MQDAAPKTGQHSVEDVLTREALNAFFDDADAPRTAPTTGGVNNVVNYVELGDGRRYILRIYNNGNKTEKVRTSRPHCTKGRHKHVSSAPPSQRPPGAATQVRTEHAILQQLGRQDLSFAVPRALPARSSGEPYVVLSSGAAACVFEVIPGVMAPRLPRGAPGTCAHAQSEQSPFRAPLHRTLPHPLHRHLGQDHQPY